MLEEEIQLEREKTYLIFRIGDENFGVDVMNIQAISNLLPITRVPRSPKFIQGVINLRGKILPVINLRKRLGFKLKNFDENTRIIIIELEEKTIGMIVEVVMEVSRISISEIEPTPEMVKTEISKEYLQGIAKVGTKLIIILDIIKVLTKEEIEEIKSFEGKISGKNPKKKKEEEVNGKKTK